MCVLSDFNLFSSSSSSYVCMCEELGFLCAQNTIRAWNLTNCPFCGVRTCVFAASCVTKKYCLFSCDNTRYRSVWRCDLCVSVVTFFLFCLNFAPNIFCFDFMVAFFGSAADWDWVFATLRASPLNNPILKRKKESYCLEFKSNLKHEKSNSR